MGPQLTIETGNQRREDIMSRTGEMTLCFVLLFSALPIISRAQQIDDRVPPAPIPGQILTGKKVFIANAGIDSGIFAGYIASHTGSPNGFYDQFYLAVKSWGRYEPVPAPADADLVIEISMNREPGFSDPHFLLRIFDRPTNVLLWSFLEQVGAGSGRQASRIKEWNNALNKLVSDVKVLSLPAMTSPGAANR
jgi:hypothetical protein